jgi:D-sedoheptulose 7-phosphate isomerase
LSHLRKQVTESEKVKADFFAKNAEAIVRIASVMGECMNTGGKLLICGNGGSASDAQHFSGEMVGRFLKERRALPAIALSTDTAILTAVGNDYGYDQVFSRSVEALGRPGDILFALSTSGNSTNVMKAVEAAKKQGMKVVGFSGGSGGKLASVSDYFLNVELGKNSARIQEVHIMIIHLLVDLLDEFFNA